MDRQALKIMDMLRTIKPVATPCAPQVRDWWDNKALPVLRDQALSELRRSDGFAPRLIGFMTGGDMGIVDLSKATGGTWGSSHSKDATAVIHKIAAMVPGTYASVFCTETWTLRGNGRDEFDRQPEKYPRLADHPDREEAMMFVMLHYESAANQMMQLSTMIDIVKVFSADPTPATWRHTKLSDTAMTSDPLADRTMTGRFIFGDPENPS